MAGNTTEDSSNRKVTIFCTLSLEHHYVRDFNHVRICHMTRGQNGLSALLLAKHFTNVYISLEFMQTTFDVPLQNPLQTFATQDIFQNFYVCKLPWNLQTTCHVP